LGCVPSWLKKNTPRRRAACCIARCQAFPWLDPKVHQVSRGLEQSLCSSSALDLIMPIHLCHGVLYLTLFSWYPTDLHVTSSPCHFASTYEQHIRIIGKISRKRMRKKNGGHSVSRVFPRWDSSTGGNPLAPLRLWFSIFHSSDPKLD